MAVDLEQIKGLKGPPGSTEKVCASLTIVVCAISARHHWSVWLPFFGVAASALLAIYVMFSAMLRAKGLIPNATWKDLMLIALLPSLIAGFIFGGVGVALADVVKLAVLSDSRSQNERAFAATALLLLAGLYFHYLRSTMQSTVGGLEILLGGSTGWFTAHFGTAAAPTLPLLVIGYAGAVLLIAQGIKDVVEAATGRDDLFAALMIDFYGAKDLTERQMASIGMGGQGLDQR